MIDTLLLFPLAAGLLFTVSAAPLGCFMVWRRLSFFGDMIAHASLFGVVLALILEAPSPLIGILITALLMTFFLIRPLSKGLLSRDTYLALLSHGTLGVGLCALSFFPEAPTLIARMLLGDILATELSDLGLLSLLSFVSVMFVSLYWRPLLSISIHEDLAAVEGVPTLRYNALFMGILSLNIALATQYLGTLLVTALLILPASTARYFAKTPLGMVLQAFTIGVLGLFLGFWASDSFDTATAPSLVATHVLLFLMGILLHRLTAKKVVA